MAQVEGMMMVKVEALERVKLPQQSKLSDI
jgi:hypothetical protein